VPDAPLCCAAWRGGSTMVDGEERRASYLAVGDCGGVLSVFRLVPLEEEVGKRRNDEHRDPVRAQLIYRLRLEDYGTRGDMITDLKYLPDQNRLACCARDGTLSIFSLSFFEEKVPRIKHVVTLGLPPQHARGAHPTFAARAIGAAPWTVPLEQRSGTGMCALDWSPLHKYFATAGPGRHVLLWSTHDKSVPIKVLDGHADVVCDVTFVDTRHQLISISVDQTIRLWDMRTMSLDPVQTLQLDPGNLTGPTQRQPARLCASGGTLVAGCTHCARWDPAVEGASIGQAAEGAAGDRARLKAAIADGIACQQRPPARLTSELKVHSASTNEQLQTARPVATDQLPLGRRHAHAVGAVMVGLRYIPGLRQLMSIDRSGRLKIWDVDNGAALFSFRADHDGSAISAFSIDEDRRRAVTAAENGTVKVWNPNAGNLLASFAPPDDAEEHEHATTAADGTTPGLRAAPSRGSSSSSSPRKGGGGPAAGAGAATASLSLEVRSLAFWKTLRQWVAVGWSRQLVCYEDKPGYGAKPPSYTNSERVTRHKISGDKSLGARNDWPLEADVLCSALQHPFLVLGADDGTVVVWRAASNASGNAKADPTAGSDRGRLCAHRRSIRYSDYGSGLAASMRSTGHTYSSMAAMDIDPSDNAEELAVECMAFGGCMGGSKVVLLTGHGDGCVRLWNTRTWSVSAWWIGGDVEGNSLAEVGVAYETTGGHSPHVEAGESLLAVSCVAMDSTGSTVWVTAGAWVTAYSVAQLPDDIFSVRAHHQYGELGERLQPHLLVRWRAHMQDVQSLVLLEDPQGLVITASLDCEVTLWHRSGEKLGAFGSGRWDLPAIMATRHTTALHSEAPAVNAGDWMHRPPARPDRSSSSSSSTATTEEEQEASGDDMFDVHRPLSKGSERPHTRGSSGTSRPGTGHTARSAAFTPVQPPALVNSKGGGIAGQADSRPSTAPEGSSGGRAGPAPPVPRGRMRAHRRGSVMPGNTRPLAVNPLQFAPGLGGPHPHPPAFGRGRGRGGDEEGGLTAEELREQHAEHAWETGRGAISAAARGWAGGYTMNHHELGTWDRDRETDARNFGALAELLSGSEVAKLASVSQSVRSQSVVIDLVVMMDHPVVLSIAAA
jgi:WD40 repeat protein